MSELLYNNDTYKIMGICMSVHRELRKDFSEVVYGGALEIEFIHNNINYSREKQFDIIYKGNVLPHKYKADFTIEKKIVLEIKAISNLTNSNIKQILNYLAVSKLKLGILINFGEDSLKHKRVIL